MGKQITIYKFFLPTFLALGRLSSEDFCKVVVEILFLFLPSH